MKGSMKQEHSSLVKAKHKLDTLLLHLDEYGEQDLNLIRDLAWEAKKALEKVK